MMISAGDRPFAMFKIIEEHSSQGILAWAKATLSATLSNLKKTDLLSVCYWFYLHKIENENQTFFLFHFLLFLTIEKGNSLYLNLNFSILKCKSKTTSFELNQIPKDILTFMPFLLEIWRVLREANRKETLEMKLTKRLNERLKVKWAKRSIS